jgi:hypothetical protein
MIRIGVDDADGIDALLRSDCRRNSDVLCSGTRVMSLLMNVYGMDVMNAIDGDCIVYSFR